MKLRGPGGLLASYIKINWHVIFVRRLAKYLAVFVGVILILSLVLLSPILLRQLGIFTSANWAQLSEIGQTYGAASAVLSGIALIGISLSLLIQARQARNERIRLVFERHTQLLTMELEHLDIYGPVFGLNPPPGIDARQFLFCTMVMNYQRLGFLTGTILEEDLRGEGLPDMFGAEPTRIWWESVKHLWLNSPGLDRRDRKFARIVEDEYWKAVKKRPSVEQSNPKIPEPKDRKTGKIVAALGLSVAVAIIFKSHRFTKSRYDTVKTP